jgi:cell division protein FtsI (penicillin-binding protein 3)
VKLLIERRSGLLFALFVVAFTLVMLRAVWLQGVKGSELRADARSQQTATIDVPAMRGSILDRSGKPLAVSEEAATVFATPYQVENPPRTARRLAEKLHADPEELLPKLTAESGFEYLARQVDTIKAERVRKLELPGIGILPDSARTYPQDEIAGRLIGAVGTDGQGLFGIEAAQQDALQGTDGELSLTLDALGEEIGREELVGAEAGGDVQLTIDASIQARTEEVLERIGEDYEPAGATAIVMDPGSAEVLAMGSWPPVDPTDLSETDPDALSNMGTGFTYEPGSTFKAFTVAGALEEGVVEPTTTFDLPPTIQVADRVIEESHPRGAETMDVARILAVSSNVGAVTVGLELNRGQYGKRFDRWIRRFGFSRPTGIDFPAEEGGIVPEPKSYSGSTMGNLPIGQGLAVTPIQMMAGYAAIANGGVLRTPRLVEAVDGEPVASGEGERVISRRTSEQLREMLGGVLEPGGTASVSVPGYELAGKTGTSQKVVDGAYSETEYVASFVGFAPADDPELLVSIAVDYPKGDIYGGSVAAPAFGEIATFALPYLGVKTG